MLWCGELKFSVICKNWKMKIEGVGEEEERESSRRFFGRLKKKEDEERVLKG